MSSSRRSSAGTSTWDRLAGLGERKLAELDAGAGHQVLAPVRRQRRQAQRVQAPDKAVDHVVGDIQNGIVKLFTMFGGCEDWLLWRLR